MTINDLKLKIADIVGVSYSEKELAYDIFISKLTDILSPNLTLKIPAIGYFQLREQREDKSEIIFSPTYDDLNFDSKNIFISIETPLQKKIPNELEDNETHDIFSIGVGKPYLPLAEKFDDDTEASYVYLKKSIEERINDIFSEAEHLPDFNLLDQYEKIISEDKNISIEQTLAELTSDLNFDNKNIDIKEEQIVKDITKNFLEEENVDLLENLTDNIEEDASDVTLTKLLQDFKVEETQNEITFSEPQYESKQKKESTEELKEIEIELGKHRKSIIKENEKDETHLQEIEEKKEQSVFDDILKNQSEKIIKEEEETYLGLKKKSPEKIEWNWGDELREELETYREENIENIEYIENIKKEYNNDFEYHENKSEFKNEKVDDILKSTKVVPSKLFEELEYEIKKEVERVTKELNYQNYPKTKTKYEFIEIEQHDFRRNKTTSNINYDDERKYIESEYGYKKEEKLFSRNFIILFISFVVAVGLIIYILLPNRKVVTTAETSSNQKVDTTKNSEQIITSIPQSQNVLPEEDDFPRVPVLPLTKKPEEISNKTIEQMTSSDKNLYRNIVSDSRVYKTIYFDGNSYNVQVSSWRNKIKAEQEVKKLRQAGYDAFVMIVNLPEKGGIWYRVRVGSFKSLEEAKDFSIKFNQ